MGLLRVNGKLEIKLSPGSYGYWRFNRNIEVERPDCRLQTIEVSGQEILTKDRVSLRLNLSASYRITDTEKVLTQLKNHSEFLYRKFQLALREVVEAQKAAEANLIRRREETQATRSLHNTAKVMEGNSTLMRLKELEILERVTSKINQLTVYGGLEEIMNDLVKPGNQH